MFRIRNEKEGAFFQFACPQFRIGRYQFLFGDSVFAADAEYGFLPLHLVHVFPFFLRSLGSGQFLGNFFLDSDFRTVLRRNDDDLSYPEVAGAQSRICLADGFCGNVVFYRQLIQGFSCLDGMKLTLLGVVVRFLWNLQRLSFPDQFLAAGVDAYNVVYRYIVHACYGIKALAFGYCM